MDRFWVGMQAGLAAIFGVGGVVCTGHRAGFPMLVVLTIGELDRV
jgi:hypothetical protein